MNFFLLRLENLKTSVWSASCDNAIGGVDFLSQVFLWTPYTFHQVKRPPAHFSCLVSAAVDEHFQKKNIKKKN